MKKQLALTGSLLVIFLLVVGAIAALTGCAHKVNAGKVPPVQDRVRFEVYALSDPSCECKNPFTDSNAQRVENLKGVSIAENSNWEKYPGGVTPWSKSVTVARGGWSTVQMKAEAVNSTVTLIAAIFLNGLNIIICKGVGGVECATDL